MDEVWWLESVLDCLNISDVNRLDLRYEKDMRALEGWVLDHDITQGEIGILVSNLKRAEPHDLSVDGGIVYGEILYVKLVCRSLVAEKPKVTSLIFYLWIGYLQSLDTHWLVVLSNVKDSSYELGLAIRITQRHDRDLMKC